MRVTYVHIFNKSFSRYEGFPDIFADTADERLITKQAFWCGGGRLEHDYIPTDDDDDDDIFGRTKHTAPIVDLCKTGIYIRSPPALTEHKIISPTM